MLDWCKPEAASFIPALEKALKNSDIGIRLQASEALKHIRGK